MSKPKRGGKRAPVRSAKAAPVALLAAALRAQSEGVFIAERKCGANGLKIVFANDSFCAMTGYAGSELVNRAHGFLHLERVDIERLRHWLPKAQPGQPLVGEGYLLRADHSSISAAWSFDPLCDDRGKVTHIVATYRDQTEKRRLQEALVHAQRLDAVGRLAGGVAHDFNNLLSVINGYCEMLAAHVAANPQAMREVAEIHHAGRKAAALTSQLLAFSRRQPLNSRVISLNELVASNAEIIRRLLGDAGKLDLGTRPRSCQRAHRPRAVSAGDPDLVLNARDALRDAAASSSRR
jgi:two-component system cell cycle sensor histidine kinase/response regulator CckA